MEAADHLLPGDAPSPPVPGTGELVVQNGRHAGTRRPIRGPVTLLGRAPGCDIRLNLDGIEPLHCALIIGRDGLVLRDLGTDRGTLVNERSVTTCLLNDGDTLTVGPFQFQVQWSREATLGEPPPQALARPGEVESLRIQAAAVAAQQASLLDEESRLQQRKAALEKQEEQLAAHLEERREQLMAVQEEIRQARVLLREERAGFDRERQACLAEAERDRKEAADELQKLKKERRRLGELRRRLRKRWKAHFGHQERDLVRRENELAAGREQLERGRLGLVQTRLKLNGEVELGRREIQDGKDELRKAGRQWQSHRDAAELSLVQQRQVLDARAARLARQESELGKREAKVAARRGELERENEGLENRLRQLRRKLGEHEADLARLHPPPVAVPASDAAAARPAPDLFAAYPERADQLARLDVLAGDLSDQRAHLAAQWQEFLAVQDEWQHERQALLAQIEDTAGRLARREEQLAVQEKLLAGRGAELDGRNRSLCDLRLELEAWHARLSEEQRSSWAERAQLLVQVQTREKLAERRRELFEEVWKRWRARRRAEIGMLARQLKSFRAAQRLHMEVRDEYSRRLSELASQQRTVAETTLALEQLRMELINQSSDSAAAEKRVARARKQWAAAHASAERELIEREKELEAESRRVKEQSQQLSTWAESVLEREERVSRVQTAWEHEQVQSRQSQEVQRQELQVLRKHQEIAAKQLKDLRGELERVVRVMIDSVEPASRAA